jgi:hypothetical protein
MAVSFRWFRGALPMHVAALLGARQSRLSAFGCARPAAMWSFGAPVWPKAIAREHLALLLPPCACSEAVPVFLETSQVRLKEPKNSLGLPGIHVSSP